MIGGDSRIIERLAAMSPRASFIVKSVIFLPLLSVGGAVIGALGGVPVAVVGYLLFESRDLTAMSGGRVVGIAILGCGAVGGLVGLYLAIRMMFRVLRPGVEARPFPVGETFTPGTESRRALR